LLEALVRRQHGGSMLVPAAHQLEEEHGTGAGDRQITDLVDDQERWVRQGLQALSEGAGGLRLLQAGDQRCRRAVVDAPALLGGRDRKADCQVRLAYSWRAEEDDILPSLHEAERVQTVDLLSLDRGLKAEVEVVERLHSREAAGAHRRLQAAIVSQADLRIEDLADRLRGADLAAVDMGENRIERLQ